MVEGGVGEQGEEGADEGDAGLAVEIGGDCDAAIEADHGGVGTEEGV